MNFNLFLSSSLFFACKLYIIPVENVDDSVLLTIAELLI